MTLVAEVAHAPAAPVSPRRTSRALPESWPLALLLGGYPVWWLLGLDSILPILLAVPMTRQLLRRHQLRLPAGLGWWLLFLLWVAIGVVLLWVDAPGAVPGGGSSRLLVFGFRLAWYVACGIVLLWVTNLRPSVSDASIHRLVAWMFLVCVAGGLLGLLVPGFELRSLVESLLPGSIRGNQFVASLVHPQAADVQGVLGRPETRPKAPFPFTNTWGSCLSITLVFFVAVLLRSSRKVRAAGLVLLVVAAVPVMYSLNRGLWATIALCLVGLVVLAAIRGNRGALIALLAGVALALVLFMASPLGALYQDRLDHQHSNDRRGQLLEATVDSVTQGSPVLGFGTTRDVEGSFASITGAATPDCPACGVPPLGTQGQLWLVVFSQGWLGLLFFLGFLWRSLTRSWTCRTDSETACTFVVGCFVLQLPIYDTLGMPLYLMMIAIGLVARQQEPLRRRRQPRRESRAVVLLTLLVPLALGTAAGVLVARLDDTTAYASRVSILITPAPVYLDSGSTLQGGRLAPAPVPRNVTVDTEAALLKSERSLSRAASRSGTTVAALRDGVELTAPPTLQVLDVLVEAPTGPGAEDAAGDLALAYLHTRRVYLEHRRDETLGNLREQLRSIGSGSARLTAARDVVTARIAHLSVSRPTIGRVINQSSADPVSTQPVVPISSGAALGLLVGILLRRRTRSRTVTTAPSALVTRSSP
ncbi:hypothetical protein BH11ACT8_BH11ACT8_16220 [soil metagenome]